MNEKELIGRLKKSDQQALKAIIELYQNYVYTVALQIVKKKEMAEEVTQDVFIKVYQKISSYEYRAKFSTWLFTIVYRTSLNYLEKKKILITASDFAFPDSEEVTIDSVHQIASLESQQQNTASMVESDHQQQQIIYKAIDSLEMKQGLVITLFYLKEFSVNEIAEIMQLSVNTVKTHLFRGRENMKKTLLRNYSVEDLL
jgi:RNA polymerase sigma factor (sigma-70 family)